MRRHTLIAIIAGSSLVAAACGSDDTSQQAPPTTLAPDTAPATDPPATEPDATDPPATDAPTTEPPSTEAPTTEPPATDPPTTEAPATSDAGDDGGEAPSASDVPAGAARTASALSFDDTVAAATAVIEDNENLTLVVTIDHAANAANAGLELPPTTELIFGNPMIGTPLMTSSPTVGIDLPQKMLIIESADGTVEILWNSSAYLSTRHGLDGVDEQLGSVDMALGSIASAAAGNGDGVEPTVGPDASEGAGLVTQDAPGTAREAADRQTAAIEANPDLILVSEIDHGANAADAGLDLTPIIEVIFGNPNLGTPLMQASRTVGMDLPQKMLFVETADGVSITYNDPAYLAQRHGIDAATPELATVTGALEKLSGAAAGDGG